MERLPNEVIWMIFKEVKGRLARLATISRRWQEPVERFLFSEMTLRAKEKQDVERSMKWCSGGKLPEPELNTEDEDDWEDEDTEEEEPDDNESDGEVVCKHTARENKPREMEEIIISQFDSFKHVFEGGETATGRKIYNTLRFRSSCLTTGLCWK